MATKQSSKQNYETVLVDKEDGITWVTLNRPEKRNAMSPQMHLEMNDLLDELAYDPETKVLVLTGAGNAFSAGQDIQLFFRNSDGKPSERAKGRYASTQWRWNKLMAFPKPTIAMVNGYCFGGAFTQLCACDFAIAANEATFGLSEVNWGIIPGNLVAWNVTMVMNYRDALYYAVTGEAFDGKKAKEVGLVNKSVPLSKLRSETTKFAKMLMQKNPATVRFTKDAIKAVRLMNEMQATDYLAAKSDALKFNDKERGREEGMRQFLDEKSYRPGLGNYKRKAV
jgi:trans-feruloyl-CoA hydratase/vanillin synthase